MAQVPPPYSNGAFPQIQQAYQNDPRTKLANSMLVQGGSTAPSAGGGWAWADGLGRIAQALGGGIMGKNQQKKYAEQEQQFMDALKQGAPTVDYAPQTNPAAVNPATANPAMGGMEAATAALGTPVGGDPRSTPSPIQSVNPDVEHALGMALSPQGQQAAPPQAPAMGPSGANSGFYGGGPAQRQMNAPQRPQPPTPPFTATAEAPAASRTNQGPDVGTLFTKGIVAQEGVQNADGSWQTSFKGAVGPAQIMPATGPEAAAYAGVEWDRRRFRTDPEYNLQLGQAYFQKQLDTFGDPLKAAAAYNAGPGAVRTAVRRAERRGGSWVDYLPSTTKDGKVVDTTKEYVERFAAATGAGSGAIPMNSSGLPANAWERSTTTTMNEDIAGVPAQNVPRPNMMEVPDRAPIVAQRPQAPDVPDEVRSSYMAMAQNLLQSDNPFAVALGQSYLQQGMADQFAARGKRSDQQFQRDNMGYQTELQNYFDSQSQGRTAQNQERQMAIGANINREDQYIQNQFVANEAGLNREQQARIASADRQVQYDRMAHEARLQQYQNENGRNPFFDTIGGRKLADEMYDEINSYASAITKYQQALEILDNGLETGAIYAGMGSEEIEARMGGTNPDVGTFVSISNDTTLEKLGGSLGVAISDGDRQFVRDSNINMGKDVNANRNIASAMIGMLERKSDFLYERMEAEMGGPQALRAFNQEWRAFAESTPIVQRDGKGNVMRIDQRPMTFAQWKESRPRYDAEGNRIN